VAHALRGWSDTIRRAYDNPIAPRDLWSLRRDLLDQAATLEDALIDHEAPSGIVWTRPPLNMPADACLLLQNTYGWDNDESR
jgi:hypothetical protein